MPGDSSVTEGMLASHCFKTSGGMFLLPLRKERLNKVQRKDWNRICSFSMDSLVLWLDRCDRQFRRMTQARCARRASGVSDVPDVPDVQSALPQMNLLDAFRVACIFNASMFVMGAACQRIKCSCCDICPNCMAYQSCLTAYRGGLLDEELAGWCQNEEMLLEKLSYIQGKLQADFREVVRQLEREQVAFKEHISNGNPAAGEMKEGTFQLCRPRPEGLLPIVWGVHRHWSSFTTFRKCWKKISFNHNVTLGLNPSCTLTIAPKPEWLAPPV